METYLRTLQVAGIGERLQWSIRPHGPSEIDQLPALTDSGLSHPWRRKMPPPTGSRYVVPLPPVFGLRFNSSFPYGVGDGAVWAGRGVTLVGYSGVDSRLGPVSFTIAPLIFWTQNAGTSLLEHQDDTVSVFADGVFPYSIDKPQRFGSAGYSRLDPGQSTVRLDAAGLSFGGSTANEGWGPGTRFGYILTSQAAGFPRLFAGTSHGIPIGIGRLSARFVWGQLRQTEHSPAADSVALRYASGGTVTLKSRDLEFGMSRFFHEMWPRGGFTHANFARPFEGLFKSSLPDDSLGRAGYTRFSNQLASAFARWVFRGAEIYGELGREDHAYDRRDLIVEPDHVGSIMLGGQRTWTGPNPDVISSFQVEWISYRATQVLLRRGGGATYIHSDFRQGHTHHGQVLGADAGVGNGSGLHIAHTRYTPDGLRRIHLSRTLRYDGLGFALTGVPASRIDVIYAGGFDRLFFLAGADAAIGVTGLLNLGRNFRHDVAGINLSVSLRPNLRRR